MKSTDVSFMESVITTLSQVERQLLALLYAEGLTREEVGLVLDMSLPQVNHMLHEIREKTRAALRQWENGQQAA